MIVLAVTLSIAALVMAGLLRAAGVSLLHTTRADALLDAAEEDQRAEIVVDLLANRYLLQSALGVASTTLIISAVIPATWVLATSLSGWALSGGLVILGSVLIFVGDLTPRSFGRNRPRSLAYSLARPLRAAVVFGNWTLGFIRDLESEEKEETESDKNGESELELISSVLEFSDAIVREVMTPRTDLVAVLGSDSTDHALEVVLETGRSRIPVFGEGPDDVLGILYARDILELMDADTESVLVLDIMRNAYFVPETKSVPQLLREMQGNQIHLAMVVDEFGGTAGVVTIEDLLEEIVGEITDEYDTEEPLVTEMREGELLIDGRLGVAALGEMIGIDLPDSEWDTVGGFMLSLAGRVPEEGESFEYELHIFIAEKVLGRRVARVRLLLP